jgi:hypothetical protein
MGPPLEIEVKLGLPSGPAHDRLLAALQAAGAEVESRRQINRFYDGPGGEISAARIALRVREETTDRSADARSAPGRPRCVMTLKAGGALEGAVHERTEWEAEISPTLAEVEAEPGLLLSLPVGPSAELRRLVPVLDRLVGLGGFENERTVVPVSLEIRDESGRPQAVPTLWELDRITFIPGPVEYELEVEMPRAARVLALSAPALESAVRARLAQLGVPWVAQPLSKYARFRRYVLGREE